MSNIQILLNKNKNNKINEIYSSKKEKSVLNYIFHLFVTYVNIYIIYSPWMKNVHSNNRKNIMKNGENST